jgi:hypothetical protein
MWDSGVRIAPRDPRVSGVFSPTGAAVAKDGGFVVNVRWG